MPVQFSFPYRRQASSILKNNKLKKKERKAHELQRPAPVEGKNFEAERCQLEVLYSQCGD